MLVYDTNISCRYVIVSCHEIYITGICHACIRYRYIMPICHCTDTGGDKPADAGADAVTDKTADAGAGAVTDKTAGAGADAVTDKTANAEARPHKRPRDANVCPKQPRKHAVTATDPMSTAGHASASAPSAAKKPRRTLAAKGTGTDTASCVKAFDSMQVYSLAQDRKIKQIRALAGKAIDMITKKLKAPSKGWRAHMPIWLKKVKPKKRGSRGLKAWSRDESFCGAWLQEAVEFYGETIGVPPVVTGVRKKVKKKKTKGARLNRRGHTRGQIVLSQAHGSNLIDYRTIFQLVVAAYYVQVASPVVEDGTDASHAVLAVIMEPATFKAILSTVCHVEHHEDMSCDCVIDVILYADEESPPTLG